MPVKLTRRQMPGALAPVFLRGAQAERPNLLMILSDDHSAEFLGASNFAARPVLELYDLESDPAEMQNLAGSRELASVQRALTEALQEKMILDWDYLPLPLNG